MDRFEAMSLLVAVVEAGSFSAASRRLNIPLPTVSRKIAELEKHLKASLLLRSARKLTLTPAGKEYLAASRSILKQIDDAERAASGEYKTPKGRLTITSPILLGKAYVLPVVTAFLQAFPEVNVEIILTQGALLHIDEHIDIAFWLGHFAASGMASVELGLCRKVVVGSPAYFSTYGKPENPGALSEGPRVTFADPSGGGPWTFRHPHRPACQALTNGVRLTINTAEAAIDAAMAGVGLTQVLSYQVERHIAAGALIAVLEDYEVDPLPISIVHKDVSHLAAKIHIFREFSVPRLRRALCWREAANDAPIRL